MVVPMSEENIGFIITHIRKEMGASEIEKQLRSAVKELSGIAFRLAEHDSSGTIFTSVKESME